MSDRIIQSNKEELYASCIKRKMEGWRLAQICAVTINDLDMDTLRICLKEDEPISSITQIYPCAFLQENEAAELFGVKIENITMDYKHKLYRIEADTPFKAKEDA